ncbi:uncharacterized protein UTRI_02835 [Ustilago trichophora]|uniref:Uncharacterized protein n=1 Tax=Ustilago trichophora TaxID=86804 RepID=A0A5C3EP01_9BASI|nr:uncharacterized protein UTRI_02835 [Ustilago trichophora]
MMDASLPADHSDLSDLSAASIHSDRLYPRPSPPSDPASHLSSTSNSALINPATSVSGPSQPLRSASFIATPGPSRFTQVQHDSSGNAWTPSPPDASSSHSSSKNRSTRRSSPSVKDGNESMGSSLGTFDFSNASFSESFLRQAGAHMLAGLDEAHLPPAQSSSSSPRYRTSSSPTVTARPIRPDPTTPFTGKSLRTRMLEAGIINSPASSDGSSPSRSPTARVLSDSYTGPSPGDRLSKDNEDQDSQAFQDSPLVERFQEDQPSSQKDPLSSPSWRNEIAQDSMGDINQSEWQEGLSMVPEESYVEDASQLPTSPAVQIHNSQRSLLLASPSRPPRSQPKGVECEKDASDSSVIESDFASANQPHTSSKAPSPAKSTSGTISHHSEVLAEQQKIHSTNIPVPAPPERSSPPSSPAALATPPSVSHKVSTPRSFARLRMVTPAKSSPLSRVVNFSPLSAGGSSQWQSPASQRSVNMDVAASPSPAASVVELHEVSETRSMSKSSRHEHHAHQEPATPEEQSQHPIISADTPAVTVAEQHSRDETLPQSTPQTPNGHAEAKLASATPSRFWSPATSVSFATPASQRPAEAWSPAPATPATPALLHTPSGSHTNAPQEAFSSPAADFGTPQWTPSATLMSARPDEVKQEEQKSQAEFSFKGVQNEEEEPSSSSTCSSVSEKKQSGDVSTASQPVADQKTSPLSPNKDAKQDLSLVSTHQLDSSPSAARFSRMQLSRVPPSLALPQLPSLPELGLVANAFNSLTQLSDSRIARLLAQLSASMARIKELEAALEARDHDVAELDELRYTLSQLSEQYQELVADADEKDAHMAELVKTLQGQIASLSKEKNISELETELQEERRMREVERRDFEVRMQGLLNPASTIVPSSSLAEQATSVQVAGDQMQREVEQAKEQLRLTLEKDFEIRRAMEQREFQERVQELERELANKPTPTALNTFQEASSTSDLVAERRDLQRQNEHLTAELDRRFEELSDLREDLESLTTRHDAANDRIAQLEEALAEAQSQPHSHSLSHSKREEELEEELESLRETIAERESQVERLEETLTLTNSRLTTLAGHHDELMQQHESVQSHTAALATRVHSLESHILNLESQLHTPVTPAKNEPCPPTVTATPSNLATNTDPTTPAPDRVTKLERQIASLNLELLKLGRANDALQEDNVHFSIALSAKQLELGMVKRNARFALKNAHAQRAVGDVGLPVSKKVADSAVIEAGKKVNKVQEVAVDFPSVPKTQFGAAQEGKENLQPQPMQSVNQARQHARQLLAQRRALSTTTGVSNNAGQERRQRLALTAQ